MDSQCGSPGYKTTGWLQGLLRLYPSEVDQLSSFLGRSNEFQELMGGLVVKSKLSPSSSSVALKLLNPSQKRSQKVYFDIEVKTKSDYKILNFVFQLIKNTNWHFVHMDSL